MNYWRKDLIFVGVLHTEWKKNLELALQRFNNTLNFTQLENKNFAHPTLTKYANSKAGHEQDGTEEDFTPC